METDKLAALSRAYLLNGFADVQDIAIPLLHLYVGNDPHPRCPVRQKDEYVGVVTEDADCLDSVLRSMQHVNAQCEVCLSMCDYTFQPIYKLYVVLTRVTI